jgi:hypothetical protein
LVSEKKESETRECTGGRSRKVNNRCAYCKKKTTTNNNNERQTTTTNDDDKVEKSVSETKVAPPEAKILSLERSAVEKGPSRPNDSTSVY